VNRDIVTKAILIPTDPRTGKPMVTSAMKAACIGEFSVDTTIDCPDCRDLDTCDGCGTCKGTGLIVQDIDIPWDTIKDIYKMMAAAAAAEITPGVTPPLLVYGYEPAHGGDRAAIALMYGMKPQMTTFILDPPITVNPTCDPSLYEVKVDTRPITSQGIPLEFCPVCILELLELDEMDGAQRLKCPICGFTRDLP